MNMKILSAIYKTSVVKKEDLIKDDFFQFAFVGRSNVGKSSFINKLVNQNRLAKTSSTPGLTKMINYFFINEKFYFVDLPGYGFAKTDNKNKMVWADVIEKYLYPNEKLLTVFVLVDIRHLPSLQDKKMIEFLTFYNIPYKIIATKADKLSKCQISKSMELISKDLKIRKEMITAVSNQNGQGIENVLNFIQAQIELTEAKNG